MKKHLLALSAVLLSGAAQAVPVLDRSSWGDTAFFSALIVGQGQTGNKQSAMVVFDVINSGLLSSIDLALSGGNQGDAQLTVFRGDVFNGGIPSGGYGSGLGSAQVALSALPGRFDPARPASFGLSALNINVTAGEKISFIVTGAEPFHFGPGINNTFNLYSAAQSGNGGQPRAVVGVNSYSSGNVGIAFSGPGDEYVGSYMFRAFVDNGAAAVPEPTSWITMIVGFGLVGFSLRTCRSAKVTYA